MIAKTFGLVAGATMLMGLATAGADALPIAPAVSFSDAPAVTLVAGGCGAFAHRGPFGGCRPNGRFVRRPLVRRPFIRRPAIIIR